MSIFTTNYSNSVTKDFGCCLNMLGLSKHCICSYNADKRLDTAKLKTNLSVANKNRSITRDGAIPKSKRIIEKVWAGHSKTKESLFFYS